jgi:hypothetical protein
MWNDVSKTMEKHFAISKHAKTGRKYTTTYNFVNHNMRWTFLHTIVLEEQ